MQDPEILENLEDYEELNKNGCLKSKEVLEVLEDTNPVEFNLISKILLTYLRNVIETIIMRELIVTDEVNRPELKTFSERCKYSVILIDLEFIKKTARIRKFKEDKKQKYNRRDIVVDSIYMMGDIRYGNSLMKRMEQIIIRKTFDEIADIIVLDFDMEDYVNNYFMVERYKNISFNSPFYKNCPDLEGLVRYSQKHKNIINNIIVIIENKRPIRSLQENPHISKKRVFTELGKDNLMLYYISSLMRTTINITNRLLIHSAELPFTPVCNYIISNTLAKERYNITETIQYYKSGNESHLRSKLNYEVFDIFYNLITFKDIFLVSIVVNLKGKKEEYLKLTKYVEYVAMVIQKTPATHEGGLKIGELIDELSKKTHYIKQWFNGAYYLHMQEKWIPSKFIVSFERINHSVMNIHKDKDYVEIELPIEFSNIFYNSYENDHNLIDINIQICKIIRPFRLKHYFNRWRGKHNLHCILGAWRKNREIKKSIIKEWFNTSKYLINTRKIKFEDEKILANPKGKSKKSKKKKITRRESSISPKNIITYDSLEETNNEEGKNSIEMEKDDKTVTDDWTVVQNREQIRIEKAINKQKAKKYNRKVTSKSSCTVKPIEVKASIEKIEESVEIIEEVRSVHEEIEDTIEIVIEDESMQEDIEETQEETIRVVDKVEVLREAITENRSNEELKAIVREMVQQEMNEQKAIQTPAIQQPPIQPPPVQQMPIQPTPMQQMPMHYPQMHHQYMQYYTPYQSNLVYGFIDPMGFFHPMEGYMGPGRLVSGIIDPNGMFQEVDSNSYIPPVNNRTEMVNTY